MAKPHDTETQPRPNLSTRHRSDGDAGTTDTQPAPNISTEHQRSGDARLPDDRLGRELGRDRSAQPDGGRRSSLTDPAAT